MKITKTNFTIREIYKGYANNQEQGVEGFSGKLNIRPAYQREFIYNELQQSKVIGSITKGLPLNVIYWSKNKDKFELIDGQQRLMSIVNYLEGNFSFANFYWHNLAQADQDKILNYKLDIYICEGTDKEVLEWFETINIAGEKLTKQELRNAIYTSNWLTDAKIRFSKRNCEAYQLAKNYLKGSPIRQDFLQTALKWFILAHPAKYKSIEDLMAQKQTKPNANQLWLHFQAIINWVKTIFVDYDKRMEGLDWGKFHALYSHKNFDAKVIAKQFKALDLDDDATNKRGIYAYILSENPKYLNLRAFSNAQKQKAFIQQKGNCQKCNKNLEIEKLEADHITPWIKGGKTIESNCQLLCVECNRSKGAK